MKRHIPVLFLSLISMFFSFTLLFTSCKKDKGDTGGNPPANNQLSDADSLKLLMYNTMMVSFDKGGRDKNFDLPSYYWYSKVTGVNPLSSAYPDATSLLSKMKTFAKDPNGQPYDKYSFLDNGETAGEIQQGVAGDIGLQVTYAYDANNNIVLVVLYADKKSPAGLAGVQRGWTITSINGQSVAYDGSNGPNVNRVVKAIYYDDQASFTFKKADASTTTITLAKAQYQINPVLFDTVYNINGKKVGYFVFYTFSNVTYNGSPTLTRQELSRVFNNFQSQNISSLIVDLRYNGGGSVNTTEFLDSMIAPASVAGKEMYRYLYNDKLTAQKNMVGLEDKVYFNGGGNLNLQNVFFITGNGTASASELTINNLKPYMNVQIVGDTTYGKPVGFFSFTLYVYKNGVKKDLADLYAINFETRNANNEGGYFHGMVPDKVAHDYIGTPWGNAGDENLEKIFSYISTGSYGRTIPPSERLRKQKNLSLPIQPQLHPLRFNGMVGEKVSERFKQVLDR